MKEKVTWREEMSESVAEAVNEWGHDSQYELKITEACAEREWEMNEWKDNDDEQKPE